MISDLGALDLADMIIGNNGLLVLFLHWNKLLPRGGAAIAKSLCKNNVLQILDISYCSMGGARESQEKIIQAEVKAQLIQINKIKSSKNGMDPEKMEKDLEAYFAALGVDKSKKPSQSPREQLNINLQFAE